MSKRTERLPRTLAAASLLGLVIAVLPAQPAMAVAPGCTADRPTAIGGAIYGFGGTYNDWSVQVQVGMDLVNSSGQKINPDGTLAGGSYSYSDYVNPMLGQPGAPTGFDRTWGENNASGYLCVSSAVTKGFFEVYPKKTVSGAQVTDITYYGYAVDQHNPITPGATNTVNLRIPTGDPHGGNTGDLNGYITYQGRQVDPQNLESFRVWPTRPGTDCGVQGGSFGASAVGPSQSLDATYYLIEFLAGGQCGAASQPYTLRVVCVCGGVRVEKVISPVNIADGARPRVDVAF